MNVIPMTQCRKCNTFTKEHKCLNRPDLRTSLSSGRKRRCELSDQWIKKLAKNFVEFANKDKTAGYSLRQLTGSSIKLQSPKNVIASRRRGNLILSILNFFKKLIRVIRGKKQ